MGPEMLFRQRMLWLADLATRIGCGGFAQKIRTVAATASGVAHLRWLARTARLCVINPIALDLILDSAADEIEALLRAKREPSPLTKLARQNPALVVSPQIRARAEREFDLRVKPYRDGQRAGRRNMR